MNKKKTDNLTLIVGQSFMLIGFTTFIINYFILDNNTLLVFAIILFFILSMGFNLKYLITKIKETKE
jgi:predicted permease